MIAGDILIGAGTFIAAFGAIYPFGSIHDARPRNIVVGAALALVGVGLVAWGAFL